MDEIFPNIKERILQIPDYKRISKESFFKSIGASYGNFKGKSKKSSLNADVVAYISTKYPDISIEWIITGKGSMEKDDDTLKKNDASLKNELEKLKAKYSALQEKVIELQDQLLSHANFRAPVRKEFIEQLNEDQPKLKAKANKKDVVG